MYLHQFWYLYDGFKILFPIFFFLFFYQSNPLTWAIQKKKKKDEWFKSKQKSIWISFPTNTIKMVFKYSLFSIQKNDNNTKFLTGFTNKKNILASNSCWIFTNNIYHFLFCEKYHFYQSIFILYGFELFMLKYCFYKLYVINQKKNNNSKSL